ncbi:type VII secretion target [Gordonia sp. PKS22-38]|uniref:Type VII secretion target n=1 Tax=Gordonia prachuapensis TaxID=3115651 RepID=A0ABU7MRN9_9ACTN|nr:type VII secretion target [Gordonia sp. PKS22-38]
MTEVTTQSAALTAYARGQGAAADDVGAQSATQRGEVGELTMSFGVIGADFLAATAYVLDCRSRALDAIAQRHRGQDSTTRAADTRYVDADDRNAAAMADTELRL